MAKIRLTLMLLFCFFGAILKAQIGLSYGYIQQEHTAWNQILLEKGLLSPEETFLSEGHRLSLEYWFRLPKQRIEFYPELNISIQESSFSDELSSFQTNFQAITYGLDLKTQIYFLDFKGDCDCPTFSKNDPIVQKGTYLLLSPGAYIQNRSFDSVSQTFSIEQDNQAINLKLGVGIGLDIGITDLITLSPFYLFELHQTTEWDELMSLPQSTITIDPIDSTAAMVNRHIVGLKIHFRFDY